MALCLMFISSFSFLEHGLGLVWVWVGNSEKSQKRYFLLK